MVFRVSACVLRLPVIGLVSEAKWQKESNLAQTSFVSAGNSPLYASTALVKASPTASTATSGRVHLVVFVATEIVTSRPFFMIVLTVFLEII
jgi:hypothetical protein